MREHVSNGLSVFCYDFPLLGLVAVFVGFSWIIGHN